MPYANGQVPFSVLVHIAANFWLPPGTAARWFWFVREGQRRFGVTFRITPDRDGLGGWNAYRPLSAQVLYRKHYGVMAALSGYSSHGGFYRGQEVFAIDVDNWAAVPWASFAALAAEAGFKTNFVTPTERWHIGDFNDPWTVPAFTGSGTAVPTPTPILEDDEMLMLKIKDGAGFHFCSLGNGVFRHFVASDPYEWIKNVARQDDKWVEVDMVNLPALLHTYGCDLRIWDVRDGQFVVRDSLTGSVAPGNMWSATNAARSTVEQVALISAQTEAYLKVLSGAKS